MDRVQVEQLSKRYRLGERRNLRETLSGVGRKRVATSQETLWSLRDISFSLTDGEALGIVGRNGADHGPDRGCGAHPRARGRSAGGGHRVPP
jgi:ABC-type polysaccharide/polyol phosphate transport system ATPase subunit